MKRKALNLTLALSFLLAGGYAAQSALAQGGDRDRLLPDESGELVCQDSDCRCGGDPPPPDGCCNTCLPQQT
jgi:hypothetical protein